MSAAGSTTSNAVLLERIEALRADLCEVNRLIQEHDSRERTFEKAYIEDHVKLAADVREVRTRQGAAEQDISEIKKALPPIILTNKILTWIGGLLGVSVITLIWGLITGQVQLMVMP